MSKQATFDYLYCLAVKKYGKITSCYDKLWKDSLTVENNLTILWFNDSVGSTHIVSI